MQNFNMKGFNIMDYNISSLMKNDGFECNCGKKHYGLLKDCFIGDGAISHLIEMIKKYKGSYPYVLCDINTYEVAGKRVCKILEDEGMGYKLHVIKRNHPAPDERIVGEALMCCDKKCDIVLAVGSGVINDTGKIIAAAKGVADINVATAPSMDGFASGTSSMELEGLKKSLTSMCPDVVIGEADILASAPVHMVRSGIGDMLAKYVSLVEWQIANLLLGEYYCPVVADIMSTALKNCVDNAVDAVNGDKNAICAVTEGLVIAGLAMNYAGVSRPASGMEHYISHIVDMRSLEFATPSDLHGIQCGIGTLIVLRAYEKLLSVTPDKEKALKYVAAFEIEKWNEYLTEKLGHGAGAMIEGEAKEQKYDKKKHEARLEVIISNWDKIINIVSKLPKADEIEAFMKSIGHPISGTEIGLSECDLRSAFLMAKDIRDKYVLGRLLWDLGILEEFKESIKV